MARRFKVVSEQDFLLLQSLKNRPRHEELEDKKLATLDRNVDMADDVRQILYSDASRRLQKQNILDKNTPVLTSSTPADLTSKQLGINSMLPPIQIASSETPQPVAVDSRDDILQKVKSKKAPKLLKLLEDSNVTWNDKNELVVQNKRVPGSNIVEILNALATGKNFMTTNGIHSLSTIFQHQKVPFKLLNRTTRTFFSPAATTSAPSPKVLRSSMKKVSS